MSIGNSTAVRPSFTKNTWCQAITTKWAEDIIDRARPFAGEVVLDIACGTGVVTRLAAKGMTQGRVSGLDLNKAMLAVARSLPSDGIPIDWIEGSALDLPFPAGSVDLVLCQLGLQFFPDQKLALLKCAVCYRLRAGSH
jgi:ubiquinone/menaquinone biosynthesis C-methylase UbiE